MKMVMQAILVVRSPPPEELKPSLVEREPPLGEQSPSSVILLPHVPTQFAGVRWPIRRGMFG